MCVYIHSYAYTLYQICLYQTVEFQERYIPIMAKMQNFVPINFLAIQILWKLNLDKKNWQMFINDDFWPQQLL